MLPAPALSVVSALSSTASLYVCAPVVVTVPPLRSVVPPALVVRLVNGVVPPMAPAKVVVPVLLAVRLPAPSIVLLKLIGPVPVAIVRSPPRVTAWVRVTASLVVVIVRLPVVVIAPAPFWVIAPSAARFALSAKRPALVSVSVPLLVVVMG